jgi:hypothetical protein
MWEIYDIRSMSAQVSNNTLLTPGEVFNGIVPGYGVGRTLVSVTTAEVLSSANYTVPATMFGTPLGYNNTGTAYNISYDSISDITDSVGPDGSISFQCSTTSNAVNCIVYASYYILSGLRACIPGDNPQNFVQNGSFVVDHFSARGAKVTTDFLENYVLVDGVRELLQQVGNYSKFLKIWYRIFLILISEQYGRIVLKYQVWYTGLLT